MKNHHFRVACFVIIFCIIAWHHAIASLHSNFTKTTHLSYGTNESSPLSQDDLKLQLLELKKSVVRIFSIVNDNENVSGTTGTGFIVRDDGLIATNEHVIEEHDIIYVHILSSDRSHAIAYEAEVVKIHDTQDLALIKLKGSIEYLPKLLELSVSVSQVLDEVIAIGYPSMLDLEIDTTSFFNNRIITDLQALDNLEPNVTLGSISKILRSESLLIHNAQIDSGNSGGPLICKKSNKVLGINTLVATNIETAQTYNASISVSELAPFVQEYNLESNYADGVNVIELASQPNTAQQIERASLSLQPIIQSSSNHFVFKPQKGNNTFSPPLFIILLAVICLIVSAFALFLYKKRRQNRMSHILHILAVSKNNSVTYNKPINCGELLRVGRSRECDIYLDEPKASRLHATIYLSDRGLSIKDEESTNGVLYKGTKIPSGNYYHLEEGEPVTIGDTTLTFAIK